MSLLSVDNWRGAVAEAIDELPEDVRGSVGYRDEGKVCIVRVAREPIEPEDGEASLSDVKVTYWDTLKEELDVAVEESPGCGLEEYRDLLRDKWGWPVISIAGESVNALPGVYPGRATAADLKHEVQLAILEELSGGGVGIVCKDDEGRFVREDGSPILAWQFTTPEERA